MLNDQMLQLAFSVYNNPGVYALLLGSGVSRSASIPTGWEVVTDLINQAAAALGEDLPEVPETWFKQRFGQEPGYDALLEVLGKSSFERNAILRHYFESTDKEREQGIKLPTAAHRAIAWLIKQGYFRVVVTTNFDRLLEMALEDEGIRPDVVSSQAQLEGMRPLQHSNSTIIKLHGDYLDGNFKNTAEELAVYTDEMNALLDRIFDEYGLVVCGWSGEWDTALRQAIERTIQRRYSAFWASYVTPTNVAQRLIVQRDATVIDNVTADDFFNSLKIMVEALESANRPDPRSVAVAVQYVKKLIPNPNSQIDLEDFVREQFEQAYQTFTDAEFLDRRNVTLAGISEPQERIKAIWDIYFSGTELSLNLAAAISWYGNENHARLLTDAMQRWLEVPPGRDHDEKFGVWRFFPALSLLYVVGIASSGNQKWFFLPAVLQNPRARSFVDREVSSTLVLGDNAVLEGIIRGLRWDRFSIMISEWLRHLFREVMPSDTVYKRAFHVFDMLWSLVYIDQDSQEHKSWAPGFSLIYDGTSQEYLREFWEGAGKHGNDWSLLRTGLFDGGAQNIQNALSVYVRFVQISREKVRIVSFPDYSQIYEQARPNRNRGGSFTASGEKLR